MKVTWNGIDRGFEFVSETLEDIQTLNRLVDDMNHLRVTFQLGAAVVRVATATTMAKTIGDTTIVDIVPVEVIQKH